jgi:hypothetical protein
MILNKKIFFFDKQVIFSGFVSDMSTIYDYDILYTELDKYPVQHKSKIFEKATECRLYDQPKIRRILG